MNGMIIPADSNVLVGTGSKDDAGVYKLSDIVVDPEKVLRNCSISEGNAIILTKPLGTGIAATAIKADMFDEEHVQELIYSMAALNKYAAEIMLKYNVNACTDVTGFGLAGYLVEMLQENDFSIEIDSEEIPLLSGVEDSADMGLIPGGLYRNRDYVSDRCDFSENVKQIYKDILFDPQTSGGLLISLPEKEAKFLLAELKSAGIKSSSLFGRVVKCNEQKIYIG